jgi:DNA-binding response OmpR family regulator
MSVKSNVVLIVEDDEKLRESYKKVLEKAGYICMTAPDGYQGLEILAKNLNTIDLVLLDLVMPGVDGLEVLKSIRRNSEKYGNMPVVILTSIVSGNIIKEAFVLGATSYLVKTDIDEKSLTREVDININ